MYGLGFTAALGPRLPTQCRTCIQGYLAHKKHPPPQDHHRSLGIGVLKGPTVLGPVFVVLLRGHAMFRVYRGTSLIRNSPSP